MTHAYKAALRQAAARHAAAIPVWVGRAAAEGLMDGSVILLVLVVDALLSLLHRRANRVVERDYWDQFGQHDSLTKAYYLPEAFCVYLILRDAVNVIILLRQWF